MSRLAQKCRFCVFRPVAVTQADNRRLNIQALVTLYVRYPSDDTQLDVWRDEAVVESWRGDGLADLLRKAKSALEKRTQ